MIHIALGNHSHELTPEEAVKLSETLIKCSKEPGTRVSINGKHCFCTVSNNELSAKEKLIFRDENGSLTNC